MKYSNISNFKGLNAPASIQQISSVENAMGITFPVELAEFLRFSNGCLLDSGVSIYPTDDIAERNETFEIAEYVTGFLLVGDDSGGRGFLLSLDAADKNVYMSGLGDLNPNELKQVSSTFESWANSGFPL